MTKGLSYTEFEAEFQRFADSSTSTVVFRWESLQHYQVDDEDPSLRSFREGTARPDRSIRTDPWLARIASSTLAGKEWVRVRYITEPLSEYTRWELIAYRESAPVGEQIFVVQDIPESVGVLPDFWVFDGDDPHDQLAIVMHYSLAGEPTEFERRSGPDEMAALCSAADQLRHLAVPLNVYLARDRAEARGVS